MSLREVTRIAAAQERGRRHPYLAEYARPLLLAAMAVGLLALIGWGAVQVMDAVGGWSLDLSMPSMPDLSGLTVSWLWLVPIGVVLVAWWLRPSARLNRQIRRY